MRCKCLLPKCEFSHYERKIYSIFCFSCYYCLALVVPQVKSGDMRFRRVAVFARRPDRSIMKMKRLECHPIMIEGEEREVEEFILKGHLPVRSTTTDWKFY